MKNFKIYGIASLALSLLAVSCNHVMDTKPKTSFDEAAVFSSRSTADAFLYDVYNKVTENYINRNMSDWDTHTTNIVHCNANESSIARGLVTIGETYGQTNFGIIRKVNLLIQNAQSYNGKGLTNKDTKELIAAGKLCRAMHYYDVARKVGRFVYVDKVLEPKDTAGNALYNYKMTPNTTESYKLLVKDLQEAIVDLPEKSVAGTMNKYAAYALLSEVALMGAAYEDYSRIKGTSTGAMKEEWLNLAISAGTATEAAYPLTSNFGAMFNEGNKGNSEIIFAVYRLKDTYECTNAYTQQSFLPNTSNSFMTIDPKDPFGPLFDTEFSVLYGWLWYTPTQNLVDDYLVIDDVTGEAVRWNESSQYNNSIERSTAQKLPEWAYYGDGKAYYGTGDKYVTETGKLKTDGKDVSELIYANRDKRFYTDIVYDTRTWLKRDVRTRDKGNLNRFVNTRTTLQNHMGITNYFLSKMCYNTHPTVSYGVLIDYHWVVFRTGRAILNAAEAYLWKGDFQNAKMLFNKTRTMHGGLPESNASNLDEAWADYKIERRVDCVMEMDYYFSLMRWGIHGGPANAGQPQMGVVQELVEMPLFYEASKDGKDYYISQIDHGKHLERKFNESTGYLLPIGKGLIEKNPNWGPQNPGW